MSVELLHKRNSTSGVVPSIASLELGELAINTYDGKLFIKKDNGSESIVEFTAGAAPLTVSEIDATNSIVAGTSVTSVTNLAFDQDSGFDITDLGNGTVKVGMNSTFKFWEVDGQDTLVAEGLDHIEIAAGNGITLTTDVDNFPYQKLTISTPPKTVQLFQEGFIESTVGAVRWYAPGDITINNIVLRLGTTSNIDIVALVLKSGSTAETITLTASTEKRTKATSFTMTTDDYLTINFNAAGNSSGRDASVEIIYTYD